MERNLVSKIIMVDGMTCGNCEIHIERKLKNLAGLVSVKASYVESKVYVTYDSNQVSIEQIQSVIEEMDYRINRQEVKSVLNSEKEEKPDKKNMSINNMLGIGIILLAGYLIIKNTVGFNFIPEINGSMGYGILFVIGLMTSIHCMAMCGGINLSLCIQYKKNTKENKSFSRLRPSLFYNAGRVVSYTVIGGAAGALGSVVSFPGHFKGIIAIISGIFMVIMGLNLLNVFPWLKKLNPRMPRIFGNHVHDSSGKGPFYVGLLNGLMPCGPLQAMQLYALGTGSLLAGAFSMFMFSMGTIPLMFAFGAISTFLSGRFTKRIMKVSAVLVMALGIIMVGRGLNLSGINVYATSGGSDNIASIENDVQIITTDLESGSYPSLAIQTGIPVRWNMKADKRNLNGCNNEIIIPEYGIVRKLAPGDNIIEFTPDKSGNFIYTCWMGMIKGNIIVVDDLVNENDINKLYNSPPSGEQSGGGCCGI